MRKVYSGQNRDHSYAEENSVFTQNGFVAVDKMDEIYQKEWEAYICTLAFENIKPKFVGNAIKVFQMTLDGVELDAIKDELGITVDTIYQLRHRVKSALVKEASQLRKKLEI